jgi:hypothetical protein
VLERVLERMDVVPVDWTDVLQAEVLEQVARSGAVAEAAEVARELAGRRRVRPTVVVEHDHHRPVAGADVVQCLPAHPAGHRPVADHRDGRDGLSARRPS